MEKGIEEEEKNLYNQTDEVAKNVLDSFDDISPNINLSKQQTSRNNNDLDYNKLFNILYSAFLKALNSCKIKLDEEGFIRLIDDELYKVV